MANNVPKIAFFGAKGGVGKTTITNKFADLVTLAASKPRVLLIDFDLDARGTTVLRTKTESFECKTINSYVSDVVKSKDKDKDSKTLSDTVSKDIEALNVSETIEVRNKRVGDLSESLYLIPSATPDEKQTFRTITKIEPEQLLKVIRSIIDAAVKKYNISCVLIDCEARVDFPYTAVGAHLADQAYIIGENQTICREAFKNYIAKLQSYFENFSSMKMKLILNKVRGVPEDLGKDMGYFAIIPFTMDVVDVSEGIRDVDEVRLTLLDHYIFDLVKRTFKDIHPDLIPDAKVILSEDWLTLLEQVSSLKVSIRRILYRFAWVPILTGIILSIAILVLKYGFKIREFGDFYKIEEAPAVEHVYDAISVNYLFLLPLILFGLTFIIWRSYKEPKPYLDGLIDKKEEFLFQELGKRSGRRVLERIKNWAIKEKERKPYERKIASFAKKT